MAFVLRPERRIRRELHRLVKRQLEKAHASLEGEPTEAAVHKSRKAIKKVRAIIKLLKSEPKSGRRKKTARSLQRAARALAGVRDADATVVAFDALRQTRGSRLPEHTLAIIRRKLVNAKTSAENLADRGRILTRSAERLRNARRSTREWQLRKLDAKDLTPLLRRSYRAARRAMRRACETNVSADVHRWRRRCKPLWYHLRLLQSLAPGVRPLIRDLERLDALLGDDHNQLLLRGHIVGVPGLRHVRHGVAEVIAMSLSHQRRLRQDAFKLGTKVFASSPRQFADWLNGQIAQTERKVTTQSTGGAAA
jgi:CHAD domain-containing protein